MHPQQLHKRSRGILEQIARLGPMRKGSITHQSVWAKAKDGSPVRRGPYPLYSCKKRGKTVSKRVPRDLVALYDEQILRFRRFEELIDQFVEVAEQQADTQVAEANKKKGSKR